MKTDFGNTLLALLALLPLLASAAGTATVRVTNSGPVPITVAGQTIRPSATATIAVPAGEAGAFSATVPDGYALSVPASYPSIRAGRTYSLNVSAVRSVASSTNPFTTPTPANAPTEPSPAFRRDTRFPSPESCLASEPAPDQKVQIVLCSRPLDFSFAELARSVAENLTETDAARHDHVFVYDDKGMLVDNIGWTGKNRERGETFSDNANLNLYGNPVRSVEMTWGQYKSARDAFKTQTESWNYELANAATEDLVQTTVYGTVGAGAGALGFVLGSDEKRREEARRLLMESIAFLEETTRTIVSSSAFGTPKKENDIFGHEDDEVLNSVDPSLRACYPGVNCQLWADQFFEYLEYVKRIQNEPDRTKSDPPPVEPVPMPKPVARVSVSKPAEDEGRLLVDRFFTELMAKTREFFEADKKIETVDDRERLENEQSVFFKECSNRYFTEDTREEGRMVVEETVSALLAVLEWDSSALLKFSESGKENEGQVRRITDALNNKGAEFEIRPTDLFYGVEFLYRDPFEDRKERQTKITFLHIVVSEDAGELRIRCAGHFEINDVSVLL